MSYGDADEDADATPGTDEGVDAMPGVDERAASGPGGDPPGGLEPAIQRIDAGESAPAGEALPPVEELTGSVRHLDPRVRVVWLAGAGVTGVVLAAIVTVASTFAGFGPVPGVAVGVLAFAAGGALAVARYRSWRYEVRDDSLFLERGVVTRVKTVVPHVRIQHVDASRGPLERALGLSSVVVYTAGSRGADVTVPGLTPERAEDLQTRLKQLAIVADGEDAV